MSIGNILCPQCQAASPVQTSEVLAVQPIVMASGLLIYWDTTGTQQVSTEPLIGFVCSNNHFWYGTRPEGL